MMSTPEINTLILTNRKVTLESTSEQFGISVRTAPKILLDDLAFSKVNYCWVPKMLTSEHKYKPSCSSQKSGPSDIHLPGPRKEFPRGKMFSSDDDVCFHVIIFDISIIIYFHIIIFISFLEITYQAR